MSEIPQAGTNKAIQAIAKIVDVDIVYDLRWMWYVLFRKGGRRQIDYLGCRGKTEQRSINKYLERNWDTLTPTQQTRIRAICEGTSAGKEAEDER